MITRKEGLLRASRRRALVGLAALAVGFAGPLRAGDGGRGPESGGGSTIPVDDAPKRRRKPDVIYTQGYLPKVKPRDLRRAIRANRGGRLVLVEGFGKEMSTRLFEVLLLDETTADAQVMRAMPFSDQVFVDWPDPKAYPTPKARRAYFRNLSKSWARAREAHAEYLIEQGIRTTRGDRAMIDAMEALSKFYLYWSQVPMEGIKPSS